MSRRRSSRRRRPSTLGALRAEAGGLGLIVGASYLCAAVALGGATQEGFLLHALLQILGAIIIAALVGANRLVGLSSAERQLGWLVVVALALVALQLVPLPPALWSALPGRAPIAEGFRLAGMTLPFEPFSLVPRRTAATLLAAVPPLAMMALAVALPRVTIERTLIALVLMVDVAIVIGLAQVASGRPYFYDFTNDGFAVGFFANANHFGAFAVIALPITAGLATRYLAGDASPTRRSVAWILFAGTGFLSIVGAVMSGSMAALLLLFPAICGSLLIVVPGLSRLARFGLLGGVVILIALFMVGSIVNPALVDVGATSFGGENMSRLSIWRITWHAAQSFGLLGSGFGSFVMIFPWFENPATVENVFANAAHNDYLQLMLEGGIPAMLLLALFLAWFAWRIVRLWLRPLAPDPIARGATIAVLLLLLHSMVDYPLRTPTMATIFGLLLAIIARSLREGAAPPRAGSEDAPRHLTI